MQKFRQSSIVFEKPGILYENLKTLSSSNYPTVFAETSHTFSTYHCLKKGVEFLKFYLYLELFAKIKTWLLHTRFLHF